MLSLFGLLGLLSAAAALPEADDDWPVSIKFNAEDCTTASAQTLFQRFPEGCNPTPTTSDPSKDASWFAVCERDHPLNAWTISWFGGLECAPELLDRQDVLPTPSTCEINGKDEYEQHFCSGSTLPSAVDPRNPSTTLWGARGALFADPACTEATFFMYINQKLGICMTRSETTSEMWRAEDGDLIIMNWTASPSCEGTPIESPPIEVGSCEPMGPNAWVRTLFVESDAVVGKYGPPARFEQLCHLILEYETAPGGEIVVYNGDVGSGPKTTVSYGGCSVELDISMRTETVLTADGDGLVSVTFNFSMDFCAQARIQVLDISTCLISAVQEIEQR